MPTSFLSFLLVLSLLLPIAEARPLPREAVPEPLRPWIGWVLHGQEENLCPGQADQTEAHVCMAPNRLELDLGEHAGSFFLTLAAFREDWAELPGDAGLWPQDVEANDGPVLVAQREGKPMVRVAPGYHGLRGTFAYERLPESFPVPQRTGLLDLRVNGRNIPFPRHGEPGRIWIQEGAGRRETSEIEDTLGLKVYRRIVDDTPLQVVTHLDLDVSGRPREVLLEGALPPEFIPLQVDGGLPARLETDGRLRVQVRPGHWPLEIGARHPGPVADLPANQPIAPWPEEEVWVFDARPSLRLVEIGGVAALDPKQTGLPAAWSKLPAYRMAAGERMELRQIRRGDPEPEPDNLHLNRRIWLDFDGGGFTVSDHIDGRMTHDWRLDAQAPLQPGRVAIDGEAQPITRGEAGGAVGVEVRRGHIRLEADSRIEGRRRLPADGWDKDFRRVHAELYLPPGWSLFTATGVDAAPGSWTSGWTLLDLFLVFVTALAVARLWNWPAGLCTLLALGLLWHEAGAPRYVWLNLPLAAALLRVLPEGAAARAVRWYRRLALLALALIALPFMAGQIRSGIYPQLERPWPLSSAQTGMARVAEEPAVSAPAPERAGEDAETEEARSYLGKPLQTYAGRPRLKARQKLPEIDPGAITQTGPGLPEWQWSSIALAWNGPVLRGEEVGLWLLSPAANLTLNVLRVILTAGLAWLLAGGIPRLPAWPWRTAAPLLLLPSLLFMPKAKADFPDQAMLDELRSRLLAPADCQPACAQIPRLELETGAATLRQSLEIHALARVAVPLPAQSGQWLPAQAEVDAAPAQTLFLGPDGILWLILEPGRHVVTLSGPLPARAQVQIPLPLPPHRVEAGGEHWRVEGIRENGVPDVQLQLLRQATSEPADKLPTLEARVLPPFLELQRTVYFGLDWQVSGLVRRMSPPDHPVTVDIPLLAGESVVSPGAHVKAGKIAVNLPPGVAEFSWESVLEKRPRLRLEAPQTQDWTEIWRVEATPIWHVRHSGLVVIHHANPLGDWLPEWRPWPGEAVELEIARPAGVPGNTLTIDRSALHITPGARATDVTLSADLRSSQGGRHEFRLPEDAVLQSVSVDGSILPVRRQGRAVSLPLHPGTQSVSLVWRSETGIGAHCAAPPVDLGAPSVNATLRLEPGQDRWVLLVGGPPLGPAVLFWGILAVIALVSLALGRLPGTPLKTWQWLLLLVGLSQTPTYGGIIVVAWLLALSWRGRFGGGLEDTRFQLLQVGLGFLTLLTLAVLLDAVRHGLLGLPSMQIAGNGSDASHLVWYQDRSGAELPRPWLISTPLWVYRVAMLAWALWLAYSLLDWLRWGWGCFAADGLWREEKRRAKPADADRGGKPSDAP